jgi:hypothetical protein
LKRNCTSICGPNRPTNGAISLSYKGVISMGKAGDGTLSVVANSTMLRVPHESVYQDVKTLEINPIAD